MLPRASAKKDLRRLVEFSIMHLIVAFNKTSFDGMQANWSRLMREERQTVSGSLEYIEKEEVNEALNKVYTRDREDRSYGSWQWEWRKRGSQKN